MGLVMQQITEYADSNKGQVLKSKHQFSKNKK